jgi:ketosteroid isomerase-like protein
MMRFETLTGGADMSIKGLAFRYAQAWAERDLDAIMALHTDDTVFHLHADGVEGGGASVGSVAVREAFAAQLAQSSDLHFELSRVIFGEDHFVSQYVMSGTRDGRRFVCDGVDIFEVSDERIARKDSYGDWLAYARQVGLRNAAL